MAGDSVQRLQEIIDGYLNKDGGAGIDTGVVAGHLAQMRLFGIRQGVEFFPAQDNFGNQRKDFLDRVAKYNQLDTRLDSIWDYYLCDGQGLFYIRPTNNNYRLYYFRKHEYRTYYNVDGELDEVVIIYSYKVRKGLGFGLGQESVAGTDNVYGQQTMGAGGTKKYIKLSIKRRTITETHSDGVISFDSPAGEIAPGKTTKLKNTLNFIPCVEIFNNPQGFATEGVGEFVSLADQICTHDELVRNMRKNIQFFGNPTLLSSRPKTDLMESGGDYSTVQRPSIASNSGFRGMGSLSKSTFKQDPVHRGMDGQLHVPRVIANLEPNDRVGYIVPDAVTGDQISFSRSMREEIRTALGGQDEISISASVTATELKSIYGRVAATARKKSNSIYTHGIARCMELIIFQEERLFRDSLAQAAQIEKPIDLPEEAEADAIALYDQAMAAYDEQVKKLMMICLETEMLPPNVIGLIPDGDVTVQWRWLGPVYEDTSQDLINNSIVVRNLQELGVDSIEALKFLFPQKTDEERASMLSGFPFRMVNELQGAYSQFARLVGGMMQTPHPQSPDLPMAADPRLDLTPYLYRTLEALQQEMSYAGRYRPIDPTDEPSTSGRRPQQLRGGSTGSSGGGSAGSGAAGTSPTTGGYELPPGGSGSTYQLPIKPVSIRPPIPAGGAGESMGVGIQQGGGTSEQSSPLPVPGSTVNTDPGGTSSYPGQLGTGGEYQSGYQSIGSPDLVTQPGILAQLFPNLLSTLAGQSVRTGGGGSAPDSGSGDRGLLQSERAKPSGDRRVRGGSARNSKPVRSKPRGNAGPGRRMGS